MKKTENRRRKSENRFFCLLFSVFCFLSSVFCLLISDFRPLSSAHAQETPSSTSLFVITLFKITHHELYRLITETTLQTEGVAELVPFKMQREFIELHGKSSGSMSRLKNNLEEKLNQEFKMTHRTGADGTMEISFYPRNNPTP